MIMGIACGEEPNIVAQSEQAWAAYKEWSRTSEGGRDRVWPEVGRNISATGADYTDSNGTQCPTRESEAAEGGIALMKSHIILLLPLKSHRTKHPTTNRCSIYSGLGTVLKFDLS
jgi:hypothetical protein